MKHFLTFGLGVLTAVLASGVATAADKEKKHQVVFELVSDTPKHHEALLNNVENVRKALGQDTKVMVIAHGGGLSLLQQPEPEAAKRIEKLGHEGVVFAACENTMKRKNVRKEDLITQATTVDSGVAEVVRRQESGWSYVKSGG